VPVTPDNPAAEANRKVWAVLEQWQKPFLATIQQWRPLSCAVIGSGEDKHDTRR